MAEWNGGAEMVIVMIFSIIICIAVIWLTVIVTNKAYAFKHSVDTVDPVPNQKEDANQNARNIANN
ncbi:YtzI protein [Neobacillus piezotolerans]|nr:YtzI protein [Neobacillus piezotolerans]